MAAAVTSRELVVMACNKVAEPVAALAVVLPAAVSSTSPM